MIVLPRLDADGWFLIDCRLISLCASFRLGLDVEVDSMGGGRGEEGVALIELMCRCCFVCVFVFVSVWQQRHQLIVYLTLRGREKR